MIVMIVMVMLIIILITIIIITDADDINVLSILRDVLRLGNCTKHVIVNFYSSKTVGIVTYYRDAHG